MAIRKGIYIANDKIELWKEIEAESSRLSLKPIELLFNLYRLAKTQKEPKKRDVQKPISPRAHYKMMFPKQMCPRCRERNKDCVCAD